MSIKAIIMAGGEGTRLRPLTCDCPKPMVPVMDRPVMSYALDLLKKHGIADVGVTLGYLPEAVRAHFGDGSERGMRIHYYVEDEPLGTAGSVGQARDFLTDTFVVLSGDGLTDCDLTAALAHHRSRDAAATLVLKRVDTPIDYGVVVTGPDGRVERFVEKPGWGEVFSDAVNTGIYILEPRVMDLVPKEGPYDFGRELFPKLVSMGERVFGHRMDGYWCDIGDIRAYLRAHMDAMDGKVGLINGGQRMGALRMAGAIVDQGAVLEGPCYIGEGAHIEAGAHIGPYSVVGAGCAVRARADVKRAVMLPGSAIRRDAQLRGCAVGAGALVKEGCSLFEESVLAPTAVMDEGAVLMPGAKVWPMKTVGRGERVAGNLIWGEAPAVRYEGGEIAVFAPQDALAGADALMESAKPRRVIMGREGGAESVALGRAAAAAVISRGAQLIDIGQATLPLLCHAARDMGADAALLVGVERMLPLGPGGLPLSRNARRRLHGALRSASAGRPFAGITLPPIAATCVEFGYLRAITRGIAFGADAPRVAVHSRNPRLLGLAERAFAEAGLPIRAEWDDELMDLDEREIGVWLDDDGEAARFADANGPLTDAENQMLLHWTAIRMGAGLIIAPRGATGGIALMADAHAVPLAEAPSERADYLAALSTEDESQLILMTDAIRQALCTLYHLHASGLALRDPLSSIPRPHMVVRDVPMAPRRKGAVLRQIVDNHPGADEHDGVRIPSGGGWTWISPMGERGICRVVSESLDQETADELCAQVTRELLSLSGHENRPKDEVNQPRNGAT